MSVAALALGSLQFVVPIIRERRQRLNEPQANAPPIEVESVVYGMSSPVIDESEENERQVTVKTHASPKNSIRLHVSVYNRNKNELIDDYEIL
jgi:hypothetical protein